MGLGSFIKKVHDPFGHQKKVKKELGRAAKKAGLDDMLAFEKNQLSYWWDAIKSDPERIFIGAMEPFSSKMWSEITGKDYEPIQNQLGGPSKGAYADAAEKGIDISPSAGSHAVASAIASWYAGGALSALTGPAMGGAAAGTAGAGVGGAGAIAPAGAGGLGLSAGQAAQLARAGVTAASASADEELDPIDLENLETEFRAAPGFSVPNVPGLKKGGYASEAQARLMRATAHGWKKPGGGGPSRAVANEFVDKKDRGYAEGGDVEGLPFKDFARTLGDGIGGWFKALKGLQDGLYFKDEATGLVYPAQPTILQADGAELDTGYTGTTTPGYDPYFGGPRGSGGPRGRGPGRGGRGGGRGGRGGGGGGQPPPPRIIPPGRDDGGGLVGGGPAYVAPPAGRTSKYSEELAAHKARIKNILGSAEGGVVRYAEGGEVRPGHAEGANPYPHGSARYKMWERTNHVEPPPPPPPPPPPEELSWLEKLMGKKEASETRTERELEEMEQSRGGRVNYAVGGLAAMNPAGMRGPQRMQPGKPMPPRGGMPPGMDPRMSGPKPGMPPMRRPPMGIPPQPIGRGEPPQIEGGPQIPSSLHGEMQRTRMMNRPRRGFSGPAGAGGPPGNRVGMQDQQGGLARALQRGTGRPPMSRRSGFPGR